MAGANVRHCDFVDVKLLRVEVIVADVIATSQARNEYEHKTADEDERTCHQERHVVVTGVVRKETCKQHKETRLTAPCQKQRYNIERLTSQHQTNIAQL